MGKKGGGGSTPQAHIPSALSGNSQTQSALGSYASTLLPQLLSMYNWASSAATGGQVGGANPYSQFGGPNPTSGALGFSTNVGNSLMQEPQQFGGSGGTGVTGGSGAGAGGSSLGPQLDTAWQGIQAEGAGANQLQGEGTSILGQGQTLLGEATSGTGLFPSQQAWVNQGVSAQQAAVQQQMASEGLTSSTQNVQMQGEAAQAGAATAGQLIQGNISLGTNLEQLGVGTQQAAINALATMASQATGLQGQLWTEAMQGMGMVGQILNDSVSAFGYSNQGWASVLSGEVSNAQIAAGVQAGQAQSSNQGMGSLLGGLGQLLGGSGGGGLIGSLGGSAAGAVGGAASAAVGGTGAAAGGIGSSIGGIVAAVGSVLGF
jgi:hypothetical protein